jgi:precorrin-2 dehydrogenase/sirohydrochlorin ferrochelatase
MDYPVNLNLKQKSVLIVGGGRVGFRKFKRLLHTGAEITVVSRDYISAFDHYFKEEKNNYILLQRSFVEEDLENKFLVFAATDSRKTNEKIASLAGKRNILVNIIDNALLSDFTLPAAHYQGKLLLTVSTDSALPALSRKIRKDFSNRYGIEYRLLLELSAELRPEIIEKVKEAELRQEIFRKIAADDFLQSVRDVISRLNIDKSDIEEKSAVYEKAAAELSDLMAVIVKKTVSERS